MSHHEKRAPAGALSPPLQGSAGVLLAWRGPSLGPTFDHLLINGDFVSQLESGQDPDGETIRNVGESDHNRARGMKYRARARAHFSPQSKQCQLGGCPPPRGSPPALTALGCGFRAGHLLVAISAADARRERDSPRTRSHRAARCGGESLRSPRSPADRAAPGHACSPRGLSEFTKTSPLQRQRKTQSCRVCVCVAVSTNQSPCVWLSLGNDNLCPPLQRAAGEIIFCTGTVLSARAPGCRPCHPALEGSRRHCRPSHRLQEPPSHRRGHGTRLARDSRGRGISILQPQ